ncbi:EF-hand domain-containing protein [uncultured Croceitalea sp.]|uniref:EF-hand domain-containing protein n=1 Tax=uncultured Croceitalea sp. TaxID=1798908 RepID=UPI0033061F70
MENDMFKTVLMTFGMILLFTTSSFGQSQNRQERREPPTFEELIEAMDANEDGKLSKDEIKGRLKKNFEKIDADEDGFITAEEFENAPRPERRPRRQ